jgi:hypothetical protein
MGDFESPTDVADDVQGEAGGSWSYAGRNLHYGVCEEGANLPEKEQHYERKSSTKIGKFRPEHLA